jgi:hypothetical protein
MTAPALPTSSARYLERVMSLGDGRHVARFRFFSQPALETVIRHFATLGYSVRRWDVDVEQKLIDVVYIRE